MCDSDEGQVAAFLLRNEISRLMALQIHVEKQAIYRDLTVAEVQDYDQRDAYISDLVSLLQSLRCMLAS